MRRGAIGSVGCLLTGLAVLMAGCSSSERSNIKISTHTELIAPLANDIRAQVPELSVTAVQGKVAGQRGSVPSESVGERLGNYSANFPFGGGGGKDSWVLLPLQGAIYLLGLPIAAATAGPSPERVAEAGAALTPVLADEAWREDIKDAFVAAMRSSPRAAMIARDESSAPAKLTLAVDGPLLKIEDDIGQPMLMVRGMLEKDGACLVDRHWQWNGNPADYFDLAENNAEDMRRQIEGGVKLIGLAVAEDLFLSDTPRKVVFADGATMHRTPPAMTAQTSKYPSTVATWDETLGSDAAAPCGKGALPVPPPAPATQPAEVAQPSLPVASSTMSEAPRGGTGRSSGIHCLNPRTHTVYQTVPFGCHSADEEMTTAQYEAWKREHATN